MRPIRDASLVVAALAAHHACTGTRAFDPNPVAYAQVGICRLRDTDFIAVAEIHQDVLPDRRSA